MDRNEQVIQDSKAEGIRLAHLYDGQSDQKAVDKQVHDALLQDAIKDHHSEINLKVVRETLAQESNKKHDPSVMIRNRDYQTVRNYQLPVVGFEISGSVLYDPVEALKAITEDDKQREAAKNPGKPQAFLPNFNPAEGFGIPAALGFKPEHK